MYLFEASSPAARAEGARGKQSSFQTSADVLTQEILNELSRTYSGVYRSLLYYGDYHSRTSASLQYSYSLKTAVARGLSAFPISEQAIHDPLGDWQIERILDLAADGGPLRIEAGDILQSKGWTRKEILSALSGYEFTHHGTISLTLKPIGSPIQLSLALDGKRNAKPWSLRGASKLMPSHRNIAKALNSVVEDRIIRMGWLEQYESRSNRPGLSAGSIAELERSTGYSHDFSLLAPGAYLTETEDCYVVSSSRRIYFSRCPSCELPVRAETVENRGSSNESIWKSDRVLTMSYIDRILNDVLREETRDHCAYRGPLFSSRTGLVFPD